MPDPSSGQDVGSGGYDRDAHLAGLMGSATADREDDLRTVEDEDEALDLQKEKPEKEPVEKVAAGVSDEAKTELELESESESESESIDEHPETVTWDAHQEELAAEKKHAAGLFAELRTARGRAAEFNARFNEQGATLRKLEGSIDKLLEGQEEEDPLLKDPAVAFIKNEIGSVHEKLDAITNAGADRQAFLQDYEEVVRFATNSATVFREHTPAFDEARTFVRHQFAALNVPHLSGQELEEFLNAKETVLAKECREQGVDPANHVMQMAIRAGFKPTEPTSGTPPVKDEVVPSRLARRRRRVERGVDESKDVNGPPGSANSGRLTRLQIRQLPQEERFAIYGDSDRMEELHRTGSVTL